MSHMVGLDASCPATRSSRASSKPGAPRKPGTMRREHPCAPSGKSTTSGSFMSNSSWLSTSKYDTSAGAAECPTHQGPRRWKQPGALRSC